METNESKPITWPPKEVAEWDLSDGDWESLTLAAYNDEDSERQGGRFFLCSQTQDDEDAMILTEDEARFLLASLQDALARRPWESAR